MINTILSYILYGMSGFFFGIFGSRLGIKSFIRLRECFRQKTNRANFHNLLLATGLLMIICIIWVVFPYYFYQKTPLGGAIYLGTLLFYFRVFRSRDRLSPITSKRRKHT